MSELLEQILSRENMFAALNKVKANKGAGGIDGISIEEIDQYLKDNWVDSKKKVQPKTGSKSRNTKTKWRCA